MITSCQRPDRNEDREEQKTFPHHMKPVQDEDTDKQIERQLHRGLYAKPQYLLVGFFQGIGFINVLHDLVDCTFHIYSSVSRNAAGKCGW
jgi:hypothetical protein